MRRIGLFLLLVLPALAAFAEEGGSAGEGGGAGWLEPIWGVPMIAWQVINILLVVVLFVVLLRKPAPKYFQGRAGEIQDLLDKAVKEKEEALERLKDVEDKMARLQDEVAGIEDAAKKAADADRLRVQAEAEASRDRLRREASEEMDRRITEARRNLRIYAADLAVEMAKEIVASGITEEDERRLQSRFLEQMEEEEEHVKRG